MPTKMTSPTDTVTPERLAALKEYFKTPITGIAYEVRALIAHVERVEAELSKERESHKDSLESLSRWIKKYADMLSQRDRALAKLKELGEMARLLKVKWIETNKKDSGKGFNARYGEGQEDAYKHCAEAAEAAHKEVAGE